VHSLKEQSILMFTRTEAEEECMINRMMKRLQELKKEKETLAIEVSPPPSVKTPSIEPLIPSPLTGRAGRGAANKHAAEEAGPGPPGEGTREPLVATTPPTPVHLDATPR
jgi:hypothetical protein